MRRRLLPVAAAILAMTASARADDPVDWTGFYLGLQAGYGSGESNDIYPVPEDEMDAAIDGGLIGVYGGWNRQFGDFVAGVDADLNHSGIDGVGMNVDGERQTAEIDWTAAIRVRGGRAFGSMLVYGAAGVAVADVDTAQISSGGVTFLTPRDTMVGWTIGGGVEAIFRENWIGRLDYRYSDYGRIDYMAPFLPGSIDVTLHSIFAGVARRF